MDILNLIKTNLISSKKLNESSGVKAVIAHIEVAEDYLIKAKKEDTNSLYTDIIYRTNHAFEGILKEAYSILTKEDSSKKTTYDIENYFSNNSILKSRVADLFKNYRKEWRNPSTHDYKLFFTEQESFLAIVSVSAFVKILIDQMIEKISSDDEIEITSSKVIEIKDKITNYKDLSLLDKCTALLLQFGKQFKKTDIEIENFIEYQFLGMITGFIKTIEPDFDIETEPLIKNEFANARPDILISYGNEKIIIEIKRNLSSENIRSAESQLLIYLALSKIPNGILYQVPLKSNQEYVVNKIPRSDGEIDYLFAELTLK
jgi:hypothetical protein